MPTGLSKKSRELYLFENILIPKKWAFGQFIIYEGKENQMTCKVIYLNNACECYRNIKSIHETDTNIVLVTQSSKTLMFDKRLKFEITQ